MKKRKFKQARRRFLRLLDMADADLDIVVKEQASLGKALALVLVSPPADDDVGSVRAICRAMRATLAMEDQCTAKVLDVLRSGIDLQRLSGRLITPRSKDERR